MISMENISISVQRPYLASAFPKRVNRKEAVKIQSLNYTVFSPESSQKISRIINTMYWISSEKHVDVKHFKHDVDSSGEQIPKHRKFVNPWSLVSCGVEKRDQGYGKKHNKESVSKENVVKHGLTTHRPQTEAREPRSKARARFGFQSLDFEPAVTRLKCLKFLTCP